MKTTTRILVFQTLCILGILCGCSSEQYVRGHGDAGQFILQAIAYGGRPVTTNSLPAITSDWQYVQDEFGVGLLLTVAEYQRVQDFVRAAFGPPSNSAGWAARNFGVAVMIQRDASNTVVAVHPPMSDARMAQAALKITKTVEKHTK